jgi:hypothetical protein
MLAMNNLTGSKIIVVFSATLALCTVAAAGDAAKPPEVPAQIKIAVSPESVAAGENVAIGLQLTPIEGVVINKYPKISLKIAAVEGLVGAAEVSVGNASPPPPEQTGGNYFDKVDPVNITLAVDKAAGPGKHEIDGQLKYYYCVKKSGFCAPKKTTVKIPIEVR